MTNPPSKPGLELLIRRRSPSGRDEGFELRTLDSTQAFLRLRPQRSLAVHIEDRALREATGTVHMVRVDVGGTERYIRFTPREFFLYERMDGVHTIQDLAAAYFFSFGSFQLDDIRRFLTKARRLGLVKVNRSSLLRDRRSGDEDDGDKGLFDRFSDAIECRWNRVDAVFGRAHRLLGWLFTRWMLPLHLLVAGLGLAVYLSQRWSGGFGVGEHSPWAWLVVLTCWVPAFLAVHELAHGIACKAHGRRVKAVGLTMLDELLPSFYVDVTDMWMSSRRGRMMVSLSGPLANLVLAGAFAIAAWLVPDPRLSWVLVVAADVNCFVALYTSWPFHLVQEDGYEVFTDLARVSAVRGRALVMLRGSAEHPLPATARRAVLVYLAGVMLTGIVLVALLVRAVVGVLWATFG